MYNEVNIDNRSRRFVRGRVICATNSRNIEFLTPDMATGLPFYSSPGIQVNHLLVFTTELHGYLTFNPGSYVKIIEVGPYKDFYFDWRGVAQVMVIDPFTPVSFSEPAIAMGSVDGKFSHGVIYVDYQPNGADRRTHFYRFPTPLPFDVALATMKQLFPAGTKIVLNQPPHFITATQI